jgi:hypothetical protein
VDFAATSYSLSSLTYHSLSIIDKVAKTKDQSNKHRNSIGLNDDSASLNYLLNNVFPFEDSLK